MPGPVIPLSRYTCRLTLTISGLTPLRKPTDIRIVQSDGAHDWVRFEVPFSRLVLEYLPLELDRNGRILDDDANLARQIVRAFTEPITDMTIERQYPRLLATFTVYLRTVRGIAAYNRRVSQMATAWDDWAAQELF